MSRLLAMHAAGQRLAGAVQRGSSLCDPLVEALPVDGAAVSTLARPFESENVCASAPEFARLAQMELDLGEGPAWRAASTRIAVDVPDLRETGADWPLLLDALHHEDVVGIYAIPLHVGSLTVGAIDLYVRGSSGLSEEHALGAAYLATIVAREVLQRALTHAGDDATQADATWFSRREVHQATGMLLARYGVDADDALALLRARAFTLGRPVLDVAAAIVDRSIDIDAPDTD